MQDKAGDSNARKIDMRPVVKERMTKISMAIRRMRLRRGLSQFDLAELCGVSRSTIDVLENNRTDNISLLTLLSIMAPLDLDVDVFISKDCPAGDRGILTSKSQPMTA